MLQFLNAEGGREECLASLFTLKDGKEKVVLIVAVGRAAALALLYFEFHTGSSM